jgi:GTPase SAR1 family protein
MVKEDVELDVIMRDISKYEMSHKCCSVVNVMPPNTTIKLQFYDSNIIDIGQYVKTCRKYSCFCQAVVIVYNVGSKRTYFNAINKWLRMIRSQNLSCNVFLVANKSDMREAKHMVTRLEAENIAQINGLYFLEVSALTGAGTEDLVAAISNITYRRIVEKATTETLWPDILASLYHPENVRIFYTLMQVPKTMIPDSSKYDNDFTESALSASTTEDDEEEEDLEYDPNAFNDIGEDDELDHIPEDEFYDGDDPGAVEYVSLSVFAKKDEEYIQSLKLEDNIAPMVEIKVNNVAPPLPAPRRSKPPKPTASTEEPADELFSGEAHEPTVQLAAVSRKGRRKTKKFASDTLLDNNDPDMDHSESLEEESHMSTEIDPETMKKDHTVLTTGDTTSIDGTGLNDAIIMQAMNNTEQEGETEDDKRGKKCVIA